MSEELRIFRVESGPGGYVERFACAGYKELYAILKDMGGIDPEIYTITIEEPTAELEVVLMGYQGKGEYPTPPFQVEDDWRCRATMGQWATWALPNSLISTTAWE